MKGKEIKVLDEGFVRLVDYMPSDDDTADGAIVQAARVSYGSGTKTVRKDRGLIRYLIRNSHTTPLEMVEFKFHMKMPIFVARQFVRHRTASINEYSGRYSIMSGDMYIPEKDRLTKQSKTNNQGSSDENVDFPTDVQSLIKNANNLTRATYNDLLENELTRELARGVLPVNQYTEWYWKIDLHNLFHFLNLRMDSHSQYEARVYANAIAELVKPIVPLAWEAFEDYVLNANKISSEEIEILKELKKNNEELFDNLVENSNLSKREKREFKDKL